MKKYTLYFEFFGRRMRTTVEAESEAKAKLKILGRVNFERIETNGKPESVKSVEDEIEQILGMKNPFKGMFGGK